MQSRKKKKYQVAVMLQLCQGGGMTLKRPLRIGVIGQSGAISPEVERLAEDVGRGIGERGGLLLCGGRDGVMAAACRGAREAGGITVGILPGDRVDEGNPYLDVPITTGFGLDFRSLVLVHSCDAIIMIGGRNGTFGELSQAYLNCRPVVILTGSGGWADRVKGMAHEGRYLDDRRNVEICYAETPEEAVALAFALARGRR